MDLTDVLMVSATALSPLIAVQVTRWLDDRNEKRERKLQIFRTLMATRATNLSPQHVQALNSIDLEFSRKPPAERAVADIWQQYLDHLGRTEMEAEAWNNRRVDLLVDLLHAMGTGLGYDFNKTQIKNGVYWPTAHGKLELEQQEIRELTLGILRGQRSMPIHITNLPNQHQGGGDGDQEVAHSAPQ